MRLAKSFLIISLFLVFPLKSEPFFERGNEPWGCDADLTYEVTAVMPQSKKGLLRNTCTHLIHFFQVYISPIDGPRSSYYPTSSQYALDAIKKYGVLEGIALGCDRLMRENKELWVYDRINKYGMERKYDPVR